mgnify:CR=1 FL=1
MKQDELLLLHDDGYGWRLPLNRQMSDVAKSPAAESIFDGAVSFCFPAIKTLSANMGMRLSTCSIPTKNLVTATRTASSMKTAAMSF